MLWSRNSLDDRLLGGLVTCYGNWPAANLSGTKLVKCHLSCIFDGAEVGRF